MCCLCNQYITWYFYIKIGTHDIISGSAACKGDIGGPLTQTVNGTHFVLGIVSYGSKDCKNSKNRDLDVYTDVRSFGRWIKSETSTCDKCKLSGDIGNKRGISPIIDSRFGVKIGILTLLVSLIINTFNSFFIITNLIVNIHISF